MSDDIFLITDCKYDEGNCSPHTYSIAGQRTVTLELRNVGPVGNPTPRFDHTSSGLTDVAAVEFSVGATTNTVFLTINRAYGGFSLFLSPTSSTYASVTTAGSQTTFALTAPSASEPSFHWELTAQQPGIPLKVTVKRK